MVWDGLWDICVVLLPQCTAGMSLSTAVELMKLGSRVSFFTSLGLEIKCNWGNFLFTWRQDFFDDNFKSFPLFLWKFSPRQNLRHPKFSSIPLVSQAKESCCNRCLCGLWIHLLPSGLQAAPQACSLGFFKCRGLEQALHFWDSGIYQHKALSSWDPHKVVLDSYRKSIKRQYQDKLKPTCVSRRKRKI